MGLKLGPFSGLFPRVPETSLPENAATIAENIDFAYGELRSLKSDYKIRDLNLQAASLWSEDGLRFYAWSEDTDAVVSPLQNGPANDRIYYTTPTDFRVAARSMATTGGSSPTQSYRVGVPRPTVAPRVTIEHPVAPPPGVATVEPEPADTYTERLAAAQKVLDAKALADADNMDTETRAYTYTYANIYNEEGPPSDPVMVEVKALTVGGVTTYSKVTVQVTFDSTGDYVPLSAARIYRTAKNGTTADYYYALSATYTPGPVTVSDSVLSEALNEMLASADSYPPDPNLRGLISLGNGILAAWVGNVMRFSDAYRPWAWSPTNFVTFDYPVVGAITHGPGALVTTLGGPAVVSGVSPDAMAQIPLGSPHAGVSKWAMLSMGGMAYYACNDGIMVINGGTPDLSMSERFFTREVWRKKYASGLGTMQFSFYDGRLVVFSKTGAFTPFLIDMSEAKGSMTELPMLRARTAIVLSTTDQMYTANGTALSQFGGGPNMPLRWKSGDMVLPAATALSMAEVECDGEFTIKFFQGGQLGYTKTVKTGSTTFRLPRAAIEGHAGLKPSDRWQFEITGAGTLKWLKAASSGRRMTEV